MAIGTLKDGTIRIYSDPMTYASCGHFVELNDPKAVQHSYPLIFGHVKIIFRNLPLTLFPN